MISIDTDCIIITTLTDDYNLITKIAQKLLDKNLCAGTQITRVVSKYRWKGYIDSALEYKLEIRTTEYLYEEVVSIIKQFHNYDLPEISWQPFYSEQSIIDWVKKEVKPE